MAYADFRLLLVSCSLDADRDHLRPVWTKEHGPSVVGGYTCGDADALSASADRWWIYVVAFALVGIGNTIIQIALPALLSNVVEKSLITSRISLGQFVKALCAALTPVFVYLTATALDNWKLLFPLYGAQTIVCDLVAGDENPRRTSVTNN